MPSINNPITLSADSLSKIKDAKSKPDFSHLSWSDPELESVRCEIRNHYRRNQKFSCAYCQRLLDIKAAEGSPVEHIAPKSLYPQFMFEPKNLCVICPDCNNYKRQRETLVDKALNSKNKLKYPCDESKFRCYHPHLHDYNKHIGKAGLFFFEISPKGGYTIYVCNLNRYIHEFGVSPEFWNNLELIAAQELFHQTGRHNTT